MKIIKWSYYLLFSIFIILFTSTYFIDLFFLPSKTEMIQKINNNAVYQLQYDSIDFKGKRIGYVFIGNDTAQRVIMVHGSPGNWQNSYLTLAHDSFYQNNLLIAMDRFGYGITEGEFGEPSLAFHADYIKEFCKPSEGGRKPILVGHSMGGPIVIKAAINYSNELKGVISIAGSFNALLEPNEWFRGLFKIFPINLLFNRELKASNDELFKHHIELEKMSLEWDKINCEVKIIQGGKDKLVNPKNIDFAKEKLKGKNAHFIFIENENHFIPFIHPYPIFNAIEEMSK